MTQERRRFAEDSAVAERASFTERIGSIAGQAAAATQGPRGYLRPSAVICVADASDVAHCRDDPDAHFIVHACSDMPWLLDQLQAEQPARQALQDRLDTLVAAIGLANQRLNALPWQGDGLHSFFANGLDRDRARWVGLVIEEVASALDPEGLGLKDGDR